MEHTVKQQTKKTNKHKTVKITTDELEDLLNTTSEVCSGISSKRVRRQAAHPDASYLEAVASQKRHAGYCGGLIAGSGHHYDRAY
jgi:hypothetical protein